MISDNYVTGDNIYLRELQNFFFEVLGMMSVTHYGAIGDGRTDCYGPLQVAIDDAKRRKLDYIYVPYGRYIYTGELINMDGITFIGNPHAKIVNIRTCEEIPVKQFGADMIDCYTKIEADGRFVKKAGDTMTGSLAIGSTSTASGNLSFAQGERNTASGNYSHAEGNQTTASGSYSHAEGNQTIASGPYGCHAEGSMTKATKQGAHAEGHQSEANGKSSHAEGQYCFAQGENQHVQGRFNIHQGTADSAASTDYAHILGNGADGNNLSNAHTITWGGEAWFAGDVYVGSTSGTNKDAGSKKLATEEYVDTHGSSPKSIITAELEEDYEATALSPTEYDVPMTVVESSGSGFSIQNNKIVVGSGITKVKVSGLANVCSDMAGNMSMYLKKNSSKEAIVTKNIEADERDTLSIPTMLLSVSPGNTLELSIKIATGDIIYGSLGGRVQTWLTVEEV